MCSPGVAQLVGKCCHLREFLSSGGRSFAAAVCSSVTCNANFFDTNGGAADGGEAPCGAVDNGTDYEFINSSGRQNMNRKDINYAIKVLNRSWLFVIIIISIFNLYPLIFNDISTIN